jgi:hypothetical protein
MQKTGLLQITVFLPTSIALALPSGRVAAGCYAK